MTGAGKWLTKTPSILKRLGQTNGDPVAGEEIVKDILQAFAWAGSG
jgi:hypothetical protein